MKMVTYVVWHDGDRSVGIPGDSANVQMLDPTDAEEDKARRELFKECFEKLWDFRVHVMTLDEINEERD